VGNDACRSNSIATHSNHSSHLHWAIAVVEPYIPTTVDTYMRSHMSRSSGCSTALVVILHRVLIDLPVPRLCGQQCLPACCPPSQKIGYSIPPSSGATSVAARISFCCAGCRVLIQRAVNSQEIFRECRTHPLLAPAHDPAQVPTMRRDDRDDVLVLLRPLVCKLPQPRIYQRVILRIHAQQWHCRTRHGFSAGLALIVSLHIDVINLGGQQSVKVPNCAALGNICSFDSEASRWAMSIDLAGAVLVKPLQIVCYQPVRAAWDDIQDQRESSCQVAQACKR
jgi:hypothetical protein